MFSFSSLIKKNNKSAFNKVFLLIVVFLIAIIISFFLYFYFKVKGIQQNFVSGKNDLHLAVYLMNKNNYEAASQASRRAVDNFIIASDALKDLNDNFFIKKLSSIDDNFRDLSTLAKSFEILALSANKAWFLINELEPIFSGQRSDTFLNFPKEERLRVLQILYEFRPEMQGIKANIDLALINLENNFSGKFFLSFSGQLGELKTYLKKSSETLSKFISLAGVLPVISGYPEPSSYLIVLQNNHELRPSGGFIGSYGLAVLEAGDILSLETYDSYHLDMPASLNPDFKVEAPEALKKYLNIDNWYLRDANWSPDWPSSAQKIKWFYEEEMRAGGRSEEIIDLSGLVAITPKLIIDLLNLVGEIKIDDQVYNSENFMETLQYEVEISFREEGISEWDRKLVIGDILEEIKKRLFSLSSQRWGDLYNIFLENIKEKGVQVYFFDEYSRTVSRDLNWEGALKENDFDYLMVVDANLAAFKTDRLMTKDIFYSLKEEENGSFRARLDLNYKNNGWYDWQTTKYRSFTRLYTPKNSRLLEVQGFEKDSLILSTELEKESWGAFMSIEPLKEKTFSYQYYLENNFSKKVSEQKMYSIIVQKQAGNNSTFKAIFSFKKPIKSVEGDGDYQLINERELEWTNILNKDCYLKVYFDF